MFKVHGVYTPFKQAVDFHCCHIHNLQNRVFLEAEEEMRLQSTLLLAAVDVD